MKTRRHAVLCGLLALAVSAAVVARPVAGTAAPPATITRIALEEDAARGLVVRITASRPVSYQRVNLRTDWVVVDVRAAQMGIPAGLLPYSGEGVRRIRAAQLSPEVVRVVVELAHPGTPEVTALPDRLGVIVRIPGARASDRGKPPGTAAASVQTHGSGAPRSSVSSAAGAPKEEASGSGYVLGPDDVLQVSVWGYADLTTVAAVRPDGRIALPLAGTVRASGRSVGDLTQDLTKAYEAFIVDPQVAVIVKEFRKIRVSVMGQVAHPGTYPLMPGARVLDALSAAGGVTETADLHEARVVQPGSSARVVNLQQALAGDPGANTVLRPDDTIVVSEDLANVVSVAGEVVRPGRFRLKGEMRVLDALLMAGGLNERASVSQARLTRTSGEQVGFDLEQLMLHQDMSQNVVLKPGDTLFVPEDVTSKIYVVGDVNHPGVFPLKGRITVLQAIAMAGGPTQHGIGTAKTAHIVRRDGDVTPDVTASSKAGTVQRIGDHGVMMTVDLRAMMNGDLSKDQALSPGDVVIIPETGLSALPLILQVIGTIFLGIHL